MAAGALAGLGLLEALGYGTAATATGLALTDENAREGVHSAIDALLEADKELSIPEKMAYGTSPMNMLMAKAFTDWTVSPGGEAFPSKDPTWDSSLVPYDPSQGVSTGPILPGDPGDDDNWLKKSLKDYAKFNKEAPGVYNPKTYMSLSKLKELPKALYAPKNIATMIGGSQVASGLGFPQLAEALEKPYDFPKDLARIATGLGAPILDYLTEREFLPTVPYEPAINQSYTDAFSANPKGFLDFWEIPNIPGPKTQEEAEVVRADIKEKIDQGVKAAKGTITTSLGPTLPSESDIPPQILTDLQKTPQLLNILKNRGATEYKGYKIEDLELLFQGKKGGGYVKKYQEGGYVEPQSAGFNPLTGSAPAFEVEEYPPTPVTPTPPQMPMQQPMMQQPMGYQEGGYVPLPGLMGLDTEGEEMQGLDMLGDISLEDLPAESVEQLLELIMSGQFQVG